MTEVFVCKVILPLACLSCAKGFTRYISGDTVTSGMHGNPANLRLNMILHIAMCGFESSMRAWNIDNL